MGRRKKNAAANAHRPNIKSALFMMQIVLTRKKKKVLPWPLLKASQSVMSVSVSQPPSSMFFTWLFRALPCFHFGFLLLSAGGFAAMLIQRHGSPFLG
jgi:hypothetical protein